MPALCYVPSFRIASPVEVWAHDHGFPVGKAGAEVIYFIEAVGLNQMKEAHRMAGFWRRSK